MIMNLQYFAEDAETEEVTAEPEAVEEETAEEQHEKVKTFTEQEVQKMIKDRLAREQKAKEKAVEEAEKLAKMNAEQKKEYEYEKMQDELAELKKERAFYSLSKEASKMLSEHDIQADDELLSLVVKDSAEDTKEAVDAFANLINAKVEQGVKKALSGKSPRVNATQNQDTQKFSELSYTEKVELKANDPEKYKLLKEND